MGSVQEVEMAYRSTHTSNGLVHQLLLLHFDLASDIGVTGTDTPAGGMLEMVSPL